MIFFTSDYHPLIPATQQLLEIGADALREETGPQPPDLQEKDPWLFP